MLEFQDRIYEPNPEHLGDRKQPNHPSPDYA